MALGSQQTLGIELEFIVFYTPPGEPAPPLDAKVYGSVLECPHPSEITPPAGYVPNEKVPNHLEAAWVRQKVADVIASAGFKSKASCAAKGPEADLFEYWNVVPDRSLVLDKDFEKGYSPLKYAGVEINSPLFVAGDEAFREISTVVEAINAAFCTAVPPICGFHVHVGRGNKPLELRAVQRTASLLFVAEDLLNTLHPGCRHENRQCLGMRHFSDLGGGAGTRKPEYYYRDYHDEPSEALHAEFSTDRIVELPNRKKQTNYDYRPTPYITDSMESTLSRHHATYYDIVWFYEPRYPYLPEGIEVLDCVNALLQATDTEQVAKLLSLEGARGAYNFTNMEKSPSEADSGPRKPTIEFRQAAGSLDATWIVLWAKICLALCGPAVVESSDDDFFQLIHNCEVSEYFDSSVYDVFELLHDIGLCKEDLDAVHDRLASGRFEREPVLAFHRPDGSAGTALDEGYHLGWQRGDQDNLDQEDVPDSSVPETFDWPPRNWDFDDNCIDSSSKTIKTDDSWISPVVEGIYSLNIEEDGSLAEPQKSTELEPTLGVDKLHVEFAP